MDEKTYQMIQDNNWNKRVRAEIPAIYRDLCMLQDQGQIPSLCGKMVLDICSGDGHPDRALKKCGASVVAIERDYTRMARGRDQGYYRDATIFHGDARSLPFHDESFDFAFGFHLGPLWNSLDEGLDKEWKNILTDAARVVCLGGSFVISYHVDEIGGEIELFLDSIGIPGKAIPRVNSYHHLAADTLYVGRKGK